MRLALRLHPNSLSFAATQLEVEVARPRSSTLLLSYAVTGRMRDLQLPPVVATTRADELWRHTCFEAFLRTLPGAAYYEFNFAPSTQWAAYRFSSYRSRIRAASALRTPLIEVQSSPDRFALQAALELDELSNLPPNASLAPRPRGGDRGDERAQVVLGAGASAGQAGLPSFRWLRL